MGNLQDKHSQTTETNPLMPINNIDGNSFITASTNALGEPG
jgi:hypothetical protein